MTVSVGDVAPGRSVASEHYPPRSRTATKARDTKGHTPLTQRAEHHLRPRSFAYVRVSTSGQTVENQIAEIEGAGFAIDKRRIVRETVSGSSALDQRPGFLRLIDRLETDDVLVVTKMDRLGRNAIDVAQTVDRLAVLPWLVDWMGN